MEISPNSETKLSVRRRLIQSTLVPHKSQDNVINVDEDLEPDVEKEDDEEEYCGSQSQVKKNKTRKPKVVPQSRASRKLVNGIEIGEKKAEEEASPATVKCDFFLKVSEKLQRQKKEQLLILSPDKNDQIEDLEPDVDHEDDDDDDEEYCGSQSQTKKNKKRKPKSVSQSRPSRKIAVNGNEIGEKNTEEETTPVTVKCDFFLKVSEKRHIQRKKKEQVIINSPDKNQQIEDLDLDVDHEDDDDDEEYCGSQSQTKKNKKRKPKTMSQSRASRKIAVNGNEIAGKNTEEEDSPATVKGDFFKKVSERRNQRRQKKEQLPLNTPEKVSQNCSPSDFITNTKSPKRPRRRASSTPKKQINSTPSKNTVNGGLDEEMLTSPLKSIPDLWLEAKITAEENSRIFAGKQIHPFFSSWKTNKKNTESNGLEIKWCHVEGKESNNDFSTFHIFEKTQGESFSVDWKNWTFSENVSMKINKDTEDSCLQLINEGSVNCLQFDNYLNAPPLESQNKGYSSQFPIQLEETSSMVPNCHDCNSLWTTKYQPEKAVEICGNNESVKFLNEWLHQWHEKGSRTNKYSTDNNNNNNIMEDVDLNYTPTDSDSESTDEETSLKNVLLVTGPVGSGKSAAIYACAKEQGFQVIEVNTSDWRNGALVKQKFGEAVESHWLKCSVPNHENPGNKTQLKSTDDVIELIPLSDDEYSKDVIKPIDKENKISSSQNGTKTLILFEDIDATLDEDRGFISTIQQLAETAKRPMILTSNSDDPDLPNNLDRIGVSFRIPSSDDLLTVTKMVCDKEKAEINPCLVERFIDYCEGDIRKTIMLLQFWCQGQNRKKIPDNETPNTYAPLLFDTNAGHHVLPQLIPSGHTSKLSELIEKEITKSTLLAEKYDNINNTVMEIIEEEDENIEAKKDEMLCRHFSNHDENKFCITSCSSSPIAFTKRTLHKKYNTGISDSGDCGNHELPDVPEDENEDGVDGTKRLRRKYNSVMSSDSEDECADVSYVPESTYVPETELGNRICSNDGTDEAPMSKDFTSRNLTMEFDNSCEEDKFPLMTVSDSVPVSGEETGDSNVEPVLGVPREYQMMDECSRIDFNKKLESKPEPESESVNIVQETWRKLRNCEHEFKQYVSNEEKDTLEVLQISHGITNLISEADLLLSDCQLLTCDYLKPSMVSPEKSHSSSWHEDQLQMGSTIGQHGFCLYAKRGSNSQLDLSREMLSESSNAISLGKLINQNNLTKKIQKSSVKSMLELPLCNTIQSIVPLKSQLSLKGYIFHEYLSTLSQISRSESSRFSEAINNSNQRRKRVARNYLSNGGLSLSSEDILLLDQYSVKQKRSVET